MKRSIQILVVIAALTGCVDRTQPGDPPDLDEAAQRYAAQLCETESACQCQGFGSQEACEADAKAAFATLAEAADFDMECFEQVMAASFWQSCPGGSMIGDSIPDCEVFRGHADNHESCEIYPALLALNIRGVCGDGLACVPSVGECLEVGAVPDWKQEGEPCSEDLVYPCYGSLYCDEGVCQPMHPEGAACSDPRACSGLTYCQGLGQAEAGICAPLIEMGAACDPSDVANCKPDGSIAAQCNPVTGVCESPRPYVCYFLE